MKRHKFRADLLIFSALAGYAIFVSQDVKAQYFRSLPNHGQRVIVKSGEYDSVIVNRMTPFALPSTSDTVRLFYHEPMPDSIMPRSAIVIGFISLQFEFIEDVVPALEKYARQSGADWIVSFREPHALLTKSHWKVYHAAALLLHVLDNNFIKESQITYSYYEDNKLTNYSDLKAWLDVHSNNSPSSGEDNIHHDKKGQNK
jgi:hypothetical protein